MPVERIFLIKQRLNRKTRQIVAQRVEQKIWHMPDGLPDELPPSHTFDTEATLKLVGLIYHGRYESLCAAYSKRRKGRFRKQEEYYANEKTIERLEEEFRKPSFDIPIDGEAVILQARKKVYGKKWKEHPHFRAETEKPRN